MVNFFNWNFYKLITINKFLNLNHYNLDVYKTAKELRKQCYKTIRFLPDAEKYNLIDQMRRASTSIVLNISEGSSRKSKIERNRFYEIARGSIIEIDSCCEIILEEKYLEQEDLTDLGKNIKTTFILLSKLMNSWKKWIVNLKFIRRNSP